MIRIAVFMTIFSTSACVADTGDRDTPSTSTSVSLNLCTHVSQIRSVPLKRGLPVEDPHYNALRSDPLSAKSCLLELITNETLMADPRSEPTKVDGFVVGDLALFLLSDFDLVSFDAVMPEEVRATLPQRGVLAYFEWVRKPGNRSELQHRCREWAAKAANDD